MSLPVNIDPLTVARCEPRISFPRPHDDRRCLVMGVLNVTPDSFSDGGRFTDLDSARRHAVRLADEGADIIDIGGESTRPGALPVDVAAELDRVMPVIESVRREVDVPISIDTSKPEVMREAVAGGASIINDVFALRAPDAVETAASLGVPVCLMHMQGAPRTMQRSPHYDDVVSEVVKFLDDRATACAAAGIPRASIALDPGFGFGKTLEHNLALLEGLDRLVVLGYPVAVGLSRKSMLGKLTGRPADDRLAGSLALLLLARQRGAAIVRVHDVAPTVDTLRVLARVESTGPKV